LLCEAQERAAKQRDALSEEVFPMLIAFRGRKPFEQERVEQWSQHLRQQIAAYAQRHVVSHSRDEHRQASKSLKQSFGITSYDYE
jgi:hypothetical protein